MGYLRVIDLTGSKGDYETPFVPRIGERVELVYGVGDGPVTSHYFRVKDVVYRLENKPEHQVAILVQEEHNPQHWPG